jgi:RNA polymerase sigma-70 factor, ECF subfamily
VDTPLAGALHSPEFEADLTETSALARPDDDRADAALCVQGDQRAFERLYRANVARIRGLACRMAGYDAADELTQDVFVRAWEKMGTFRAEASFRTWLYRLAVNVMIERRRVNARRSMIIRDDEETVAAAPAPRVDTAAGLDLASAVDALPEGARQIFVLHDVEGYKHHEIGRLMGIAVGTSKAQLHRARMILRRHLGGGDRPRRIGEPA